MFVDCNRKIEDELNVDLVMGKNWMALIYESDCWLDKGKTAVDVNNWYASAL